MGFRALAGLSAACFAWLAAAGAASAQESPVVGQPVDGGLGMQGAATAVQENIINFHGFLLVIITGVTLVVLALLVWVMLRYNARANPNPKSFSHNTLVEVVWTVAPVVILVAIALQSFPLLAQQERVPPADVTLKVVGNSWYWTYEYPDYGVEVTSNPLSEDDSAAQGRPYRLAVDEPVLVPVGMTVRVQVTSADVIHSWTVPSFGVKQDAIPGRLNEGWFRLREEGVFYGQCSELCGIFHSYMPIEVRGVRPARFAAWIEEKGGDPSAFTARVQTAQLTTKTADN